MHAAGTADQKDAVLAISSLGSRRESMKLFAKFFKNEDGATAIEYGLIAALVSIAAVTALTSLGTSLSSTFTTVASSL